MNEQELRDMALVPGKTYEIEYEIPISDLENTALLQSNLAEIIKGIIMSPDLRYVSSKIDGTRFKLRVILREPAQTTAGNMGVLPVVAGYVIAFAVVALIADLGLHYAVNSVKEISAPLSTIGKTTLVPVLGLIAAIILIPKLLNIIPKRSK